MRARWGAVRLRRLQGTQARTQFSQEEALPGAGAWLIGLLVPAAGRSTGSGYDRDGRVAARERRAGGAAVSAPAR